MNRSYQMNQKYTSTKIACYTGYFVQAIINNLAPIFYVIFQNQFHISYTKISWLIMINFVTQFVVDFSSVKLIQKLGYRKSVVSAHVFSAVGLVCLGVLPNVMSHPYAGLVISILIYATGSGLIEVLISPIIEGLPLKNKSGEMSLLHSFYCWGQMTVVLITTLGIRIAGSEHWSMAPILWAIVPLVNLFLFAKVPIFPPVPEGEDEMSIKELFQAKSFLVFALLMTCAGAAEIAMAQWASTFAEKSLGVDKTVGDLLGPCAFALMMAVCRTVYGIVGEKMKIKTALTASSILCIVSYLMTTLSKEPLVSLIGCSLCGISVSLMWPGTFSLAAQKFKRGGTAMFAMLAMFGDFGCAFGPWLAGVVSDAAANSGRITMEPLKFGLLVCALFPTVMLILLSFKTKNGKNSNHSMQK